MPRKAPLLQDAAYCRRAFYLAMVITSLLFFSHSSIPADLVFIAPGAVWLYDDRGVDLGVAWNTVDYDDSTWASGPAELGYGDGDESTAISLGRDFGRKHPTYYFRRIFQVSGPESAESLTLRFLSDDGCVIYLNGQEILQSNMPSGNITFSTLALGAIAGTDEGAWMEATVTPELLRAGTNVIAVEVHQASLDSSDVSFNLELSGTLPQTATPPSVTLLSPPDGSISSTSSLTFASSISGAAGLSQATLFVSSGPHTASFRGPEQVEDTLISADSPDVNFGSSVELKVNGQAPMRTLS